MSKIVQVEFGAKQLPDPDKLYTDLAPIIEEMVEIACNNLGEELGCLLVQSISTSLYRLGDMLDEQIVIENQVEIKMESGDTVQYTPDSGEEK